MSIPLEVEDSRQRHVILNNIKQLKLPLCSKPTMPGIVSERACAFYGARWMLAAIPDVIHLVHGPVGCAFYGSSVRRKTYRLFSTNMGEQDIILGAGEKLFKSIQEAVKLNPSAPAVLVYATCAAGFIGEDLPSICRRATAFAGRPVIPVNAPGFCGYSQASGQDIAGKALLENLIGTGKISEPIDKAVNILGEFDVRGDLGEIELLLQELGVQLICAFSGRASVTAMAEAHRAGLNIVHCRRTGQILASAMQEKYAIPYLKVSFFGLEETASALRSIGRFFDVAGVEELVAEHIKEARQNAAPFLSKLKGKRMGMFFGASRIGSMSTAFKEMGMELLMLGSQFGGQEDYQEACSKATEGTLLMDDANEKELAEFLLRERPDIMVGGTKEKYLAHKLGIPFLVFPQEMSSFAGFRGFVNLARELASIINAPVWNFVKSKSLL